MRRIAFLIASVLVSGFFLWLALRDIELTAVAGTIGQTDLLWLAIGLAGVVLGLLTRAVRWRGLLGNKIALSDSFHILNIGMMLNVLPLRAGEVARSLLVTRSGVPVVTAATSIVVERLLDTLLVVVVTAVALTRVPTAPESITRTAVLFGIAAVVGFAVLIFFARYPAIAHRIIAQFERWFPLFQRLSLGKLIEQIIIGLEPLTHFSRFVHAVSWTLISWMISLLTYYALGVALRIDTGDLLLAAILSMTLASLSIAIPVSVAGIGPFQTAVRAACDLAGVEPVSGASLGLLSHGAAVLVYAILGVIGLLVLGVSLGSILTEHKNKPVPAVQAD